MLECTWNDAEAELALRRMLLKEKKQEPLANDPQRRQKIRESVVSQAAAVVSVANHAGDRDTL
jgi:hypothetical protein